MGKMARKRQRRQQQLGRPTKFMRKHGAGEFQEVPETKLAAYQKRIGTRPASPMSQSSGQSHESQLAQGPFGKS